MSLLFVPPLQKERIHILIKHRLLVDRWLHNPLNRRLNLVTTVLNILASCCILLLLYLLIETNSSLNISFRALYSIRSPYSAENGEYCSITFNLRLSCYAFAAASNSLLMALNESLYMQYHDHIDLSTSSDKMCPD